ncbi:phosphate ABC transporter permease PstA [Methanolobus psychrotolerans]|uniref:phosphate ABC transporter permease PstA n=1 Tax=Methanolobus psychrotolerans TaxID=1874706 RepID=UPI000B916CB2|nr:phosphate ABC transporter permease PstA [Methanolobus psychrotolerans]
MTNTGKDTEDTLRPLKNGFSALLPKVNLRQLKGRIFTILSYLSAILIVVVLLFILGTITIKALPSLNLHFIFTSESNQPGLGGAIGNAVAGTILLSVFSTILATPVAVGTAIYLKRYANNGPAVKTFRFLIDVLSGTPSIVLGIFGFLVFVYYLKSITGGFSLISGSIALAILILPVIERASEEAINNVDTDIEAGSYALGATKWDTIKNITIPSALSGIVTGIVLGTGRAAEESAVVIFTAGYTQFNPEFKVAASDKLLFGIKIYPFQDLVASLPLTVYNAYNYPHLVSSSEAFAAAFVLIVIVLIINAFTRILVWKRRIG